MRTAAFYILLILVILSLILNGVILYGLWTAREAVIEALDISLDTMSGLEGERFETVVHIQQNIPVNMEVPFRRTMIVPIDLEAPVQEEIHFQEDLTIPVRTIVGTYNVRVPIDTTIPISLTIPFHAQVPITISETLPVSTNIPIDMEVPVVIEVADTPLVEYLSRLRQTLAEIRRQIGGDRN